MPFTLRCSLMAMPACPPPTTSVSIFSTGMPHSTVIKRTPLVRLLLYWLALSQKILFDFFAPRPQLPGGVFSASLCLSHCSAAPTR